MALRVGRIARALRRREAREDARLVADCTRALRAFAGEAAPDRIPLGARTMIRGGLTARVLSAGRDRPWPWALTRQLDPADPGFLPRSLLPVHLNLSYRNWARISLPGWEGAGGAVVDPGGWLTPLRDGPSIAVWVGDARRLMTLGPLPGLGADMAGELQQVRLGDSPMIRTAAIREEVAVEVDAFPAVVEGRLIFGLTARVHLLAPAPRPIRIGFAIRPANPEGVAPIFDLTREDDGAGPDGGWWKLNGKPFLFVRHPGHEVALSSWRQGDVYTQLGGVLRGRRRRRDKRSEQRGVSCPAGLATGCELYRVNLSPGETFKRTVYAATDLAVGDALRRTSATRMVAGVRADWEGATRAGARIELPAHDGLFRNCRASLLVHMEDPGRQAHDYRAAALKLAALARLGFTRRVREALSAWPSLQARSGAWMGGDGEWDHTGQAIWALVDFTRLTGDRRMLKELYPALSRAARWILKVGADGWMPPRTAPAHLGPEGRYFWDALWACAGLREAALAARWCARSQDCHDFSIAHARALETIREQLGDGPAPARPRFPPDSSSASVLAAVWPLQLLSPAEPAIERTARWLLDRSMHEGGLFHDAVHSGVSPLLTGILAQTRAAASDPGAAEHLDYLAEHASGAGGWPEAFHPARGGVAGDGESVQAAAIFALLCRDLVIREVGSTLHLFQGADRRWWSGETLLQDLPTRFGIVQLRAAGGQVRLDADWREAPTRVIWHKPDGVEGVIRLNGKEVSGEGRELEVW